MSGNFTVLTRAQELHLNRLEKFHADVKELFNEKNTAVESIEDIYLRIAELLKDFDKSN